MATVDMKKHKKAIEKALADPREYRGSQTQAEFWPKFGVTQSAGSRYENGRQMDEPLRILFALDVAGQGDLIAATKSVI